MTVVVGLDRDLDAVRLLIRRRLSRLREIDREMVDILLAGKMLRSRLCLRLGGVTSVGEDVVTVVSAAVEMIHAASLLHDDVIDGAELRRGRPTFWRLASPQAGILTGDWLFTEAACLLAEAGDRGLLEMFCQKVREMCEAEAVHELLWRGRPLSEEQCLAVARGKTGSLFAFVAGAVAGDDDVLTAALQECGYRLGTAYQLADDLLDFSGVESAAGKTLGTDAKRGKVTAPALYRSRLGEEGSGTTVGEVVGERVSRLLLSAPGLLEPWPRVRDSVADFIQIDLLGALQKCPGIELGRGAPFGRLPELPGTGPPTPATRSKDMG